MYVQVVCCSLLLLILSGCTSSMSAPPITAVHPASPDADEALVPAPSRTLVVTAATTAPDSTRNPDMDGMHPDMSHGSRPMNQQGGNTQCRTRNRQRRISPRLPKLRRYTRAQCIPK